MNCLNLVLLLASLSSASAFASNNLYKTVDGYLMSDEKIWSKDNLEDLNREEVKADVLRIVKTRALIKCIQKTRDPSKCEVLQDTFSMKGHGYYVDSKTGKYKFTFSGEIKARFLKSDENKKIGIVEGYVYRHELIWYNSTKEQALEGLKNTLSARALENCIRKADAKSETCKIIPETFEGSCYEEAFSQRDGRPYRGCHGSIKATYNK